MQRVRLTKLEAEVLHDCAGQMADDLTGYYTDMYGKRKAATKGRAFDSAMKKLETIIHRKRKPASHASK